MAEQVGTGIVSILERAGERYLAASPDSYRVFLTQVGAAETLYRYDGSEAYWQRVQVILDGFFSSAQRAEICDRLIAFGEVRAGREFECFLASAVAERRLQEIIARTRHLRRTPARRPFGAAK